MREETHRCVLSSRRIVNVVWNYAMANDDDAAVIKVDVDGDGDNDEFNIVTGVYI